MRANRQSKHQLKHLVNEKTNRNYACEHRVL